MAEKNTAKNEVGNMGIDTLASPMIEALGKLATPAVFLGNKLGDYINEGIDKGFDAIFGSNKNNK